MEIDEYRNIFENEREHWWYRGLQSLVISTIRQEFKDHRDQLKILDAGCGTGGLLLQLSQLGEAEGIDFSEEGLKFCRLNGLENVARADLNDWTAPENSYDVIVSLDVLCQTEIRSDRQCLEQFYKALKPGGILILNLPAFDLLKRSHDVFVHSGRRYRKKELRSLLSGAGFQHNKLNYRLPPVFLIICLTKLFTSAKSSAKSDLQSLSPFWNKLLLAYVTVENWLIRKRFPLLFGSSLFSVSRK